MNTILYKTNSNKLFSYLRPVFLLIFLILITSCQNQEKSGKEEKAFSESFAIHKAGKNDNDIADDEDDIVSTNEEEDYDDDTASSSNADDEEEDDDIKPKKVTSADDEEEDDNRKITRRSTTNDADEENDADLEEEDDDTTSNNQSNSLPKDEIFDQENDERIFSEQFKTKKRLMVRQNKLQVDNVIDGFKYLNPANHNDNLNYPRLLEYLKEAHKNPTNKSCDYKKPKCLTIGNKPYEVNKWLYESYKSYIYMISSKRAPINSYALKIRKTSSDGYVKKEYALHKTLIENGLAEYTVGAQILHLDKAGNNDLLLIKRYIDPKRYYNLYKIINDTKDYNIKNLKKTLSSFLDFLCLVSNKNIIMDNLHIDGFIIHVNADQQVSENSKIKIVSGILMKKSNSKKNALVENIKNILKKWPVKKGKFKVDKATTLKDVRSKERSKRFNEHGEIGNPKNPNSKFEATADGVLQDFFVILNIIQLDPDTYLDSQNCGSKMRELFYDQLCEGNEACIKCKGNDECPVDDEIDNKKTTKNKTFISRKITKKEKQRNIKSSDNKSPVKSKSTERNETKTEDNIVSTNRTIEGLTKQKYDYRRKELDIQKEILNKTYEKQIP